METINRILIYETHRNNIITNSLKHYVAAIAGSNGKLSPLTGFTYQLTH